MICFATEVCVWNDSLSPAIVRGGAAGATGASRYWDPFHWVPLHVWGWSQGGGAWRDCRTGGCNKHANRKPARPGGRGGTSPSRRRSLHPVEALGGAEDLEGGKESQFHHHKRRERISPVYRKPPGECKHVALATHSNQSVAARAASCHLNARRDIAHTKDLHHKSK